jgi:hypothetical protein
MLVAGREYCDFVSYCKEMPDNLKMFTFRITANTDDMELLLKKVNEAGAYMNNLYSLLDNKWK